MSLDTIILMGDFNARMRFNKHKTAKQFKHDFNELHFSFP